MAMFTGDLAALFHEEFMLLPEASSPMERKTPTFSLCLSHIDTFGVGSLDTCHIDYHQHLRQFSPSRLTA